MIYREFPYRHSLIDSPADVLQLETFVVLNQVNLMLNHGEQNQKEIFFFALKLFTEVSQRLPKNI